MTDLDRSDAADARRFRWLLKGNGYFLEENHLSGPWSDDEDGDETRRAIDEQAEVAADT